MSKISMHIGHRIRNLRKKKGYTIEEFSKIINKSKATLSKYENGSISMDIDTILEIAEALEVEIDYLINYKSPRVNKTLSLRNSYFNCSNFYVYFYDGRFKKIVRSLLVLSQRSPSSNSANATLYKGVSNFSDYANCDNVFKGTFNVYDTTSYGKRTACDGTFRRSQQSPFFFSDVDQGHRIQIYLGRRRSVQQHNGCFQRRCETTETVQYDAGQHQRL